jgi:hypothetical protein
MKRRDFFKATAGVIVSAAAGGLLDVHPGTDLPELPDPDYDKIVTSAFPLSESQSKLYTIGAEDFQLFKFYFPQGGGEAQLKGFTYIKGISAACLDTVGCRVSVRPLAESRRWNHLLFQTPIDGSTFVMDSLWIKCQDGVIKADGEAALTVNCWRPKLA